MNDKINIDQLTAISLIEAGVAYTRSGERVDLNSAIDIKEVEFIQGLISENKPETVLEVGCAMGVSSMAIAEEVMKMNRSSRHYIVDPFQSTQWSGIGIANLDRMGYKNYELVEKRSEIALPEFLDQGKKIDFALIDGWHTFDHTLLDLFYVTKLLKVGGVVLIDDALLPPVHDAIRVVLNYPCYEAIGSTEDELGVKRKLLELSKAPLRLIAQLTGNRLAQEYFSPSVLIAQRKLGVRGGMVALKKVGKDDRPWNWHFRR